MVSFSVTRESVCAADDAFCPNLKEIIIYEWFEQETVDTYTLIAKVVGKYGDIISGWGCTLNDIVIFEDDDTNTASSEEITNSGDILQDKVTLKAKNIMHFSRDYDRKRWMAAKKYIAQHNKDLDDNTHVNRSIWSKIFR